MLLLAAQLSLLVHTRVVAIILPAGVWSAMPTNVQLQLLIVILVLTQKLHDSIVR
jgi:hypothetical protein